MPAILKRSDIIYPELSYKVIGVLFDVFNQLGYRYQEKYYQKAISSALAELKSLLGNKFKRLLNLKDK